MFKKFAMIASAMMMISAPLMASPTPVNPAAKLSLAPTARAGHSAKHHDSLFGASVIVVIAALAAVGIGAAAAAGAFNSSSN